MRRSLLNICAFLLVFSLCACSKIEEVDAKEVANQLFEYIEQGDYLSASALFCADEGDEKTLSEFLDETESEIGIDFQAGIQIEEYLDYHSAPDSYFGVTSGSFDIKAAIDGKEFVLYVGVLENEDAIECYQLIIYDEDKYYQFLCSHID